jgi:hypothetical protein
MTFTLTSTDIQDGGVLPDAQVHAKGNTSPHLAWSGAPERIRRGEHDALLSLIAGGRLRLADIQARDGRIRMLSGIEVRVVGGTASNPRIQAARPGQAPSGASASIIRPNIMASNGVVHVVEGVLLPA